MKNKIIILILLITVFLKFYCFSTINYKINKQNIKDTVLIVCMDLKESYLIPDIQNTITSFYKIPTKCINKTLPSFAYLNSINRYNANKLINYLGELNTQHYKFVVGITSRDICTRKDQYPNWGVFGLGTLNNTGCVISTFRMKNTSISSKLLTRTEKVVLHEIGHNYGLRHCTTEYSCFMKAANGTIKEVDKEPLNLCKVCKSKIPL